MKSIFILIFCLPFAAYSEAEALEAETTFEADQPCGAECDSENTPQEKSMEAPSDKAAIKDTIAQDKLFKVLYEDNEFTKQLVELIDFSVASFVLENSIARPIIKQMWGADQIKQTKVKQIKAIAFLRPQLLFLDDKNRCFMTPKIEMNPKYNIPVRICNETEKQAVMDAPAIYPSKLQNFDPKDTHYEIALMVYGMHIINTEMLSHEAAYQGTAD